MSGTESLTLVAKDETSTRTVGAALARKCRPGDCIALTGELGAGKTAFARGFIQAFNPAITEIPSPTFTLVQTYAGDHATLWHFDLYRLKHPHEVVEIGLEEALHSGITLIEWPEFARPWLPQGTLDVSLAIGDNPEQRIIHMRGGASWRGRLPAGKTEGK